MEPYGDESGRKGATLSDKTARGERYLREQQTRTELKRVNRELKQLRAQLTALEENRAALLSELADQG